MYHNENFPEGEALCQGCAEHTWFAGLNAPYGRMFLCEDCAEHALRIRDSRGKEDCEAYRRLLNRVFQRGKRLAQ